MEEVVKNMFSDMKIPEEKLTFFTSSDKPHPPSEETKKALKLEEGGTY